MRLDLLNDDRESKLDRHLKRITEWILRHERYILDMAEAVRINLDNIPARGRIIIGMRMKQKVLQWLHSNPEHLEITVEELLERMKVIFDHRSAKIL